MIKKLVIFLVLLGAGFLALNLAVDPKKPAEANGGHEEPEKERIDRRGDAGPGITVPTDKKDGSVIVAKPGGEWRLPRRRQVELPSGAFRLVPVYELHAENSRTEPGSRLALEGVTIDFFHVDVRDPADPKALKTATMKASRAIIELSRDENDTAKIAEDKLMEFWNVVYTSGAGGQLKNTTVSVGHAQAINTEDMIHLWTPDKREPVRIENIGKNGFVVTGEGLDAWVPASRDEKGEVQLKNVGVKDITVLRNPKLVRSDTTLSAKGPLRLKEDSRTETVLVTMTDSVSVVTMRETKKKIHFLEASGDTLRATLSRFGGRDRSKLYWRGIDLRGNPARFSSGSDIDLRCAHVTLLPDTSGDPFWITARGGKDLAPVMTHVVDGHENTYRCTGDVHVVQVGRQHRFFLDNYGLVGGIPADFDQLILFHGRATIDSPKDDVHVSSDRGITMLRSENPDLRDYVILRGHGAVEVTSAQVRASGNRGFVLHQWPPAGSSQRVDRRRLVRELRLGPGRADTGHTYDVRRMPRKAGEGGNDEPGFHIAGSGLCKIRLRGETVEEVHLSSLVEDVEVEMIGSVGHLKQVRKLDAWLHPDGTPSSFVAKGKDCRLQFETKEGVLHGKAEEVQLPARNTYRLIGNLAEAKHARYGTLRGRDVYIEQLSDKDVRLRASHKAELNMLALPEREKKGGKKKPARDVKLGLRADEIRAEPFLVAPLAHEFHRGLLPPFLNSSQDARYLFAKGNVTFDYTITQEGATDSGNGSGDELVVRTDRDGVAFTEGRLFGKPARIDSLDARGRKTSAQSHHLWFLHEKKGQFLTLHRVADHRPVLRLLGGSKTREGVPERMMMTCDGDIDIDPRTIRCRGPVTTRGLDLRGDIDPDGYMLDGRSMLVNRTEKGEIDTVVVTRDVRFRWVDASGDCDELTIDLPRNTLQARGRAKPAVVTMPSGRVHVRLVNYNYRTKKVESWKGRVLTKR